MEANTKCQAFHQQAGVYHDTVLDPELEDLAHKVAVAVGSGHDPTEARNVMASHGFEVVGSGQGGYAVYRKRDDGVVGKILYVHLTPYGQSILDEMPRYIVLERKMLSTPAGGRTSSDATILDAAVPPDASASGFTYSGAFFKRQEWAALQSRFQATLARMLRDFMPPVRYYWGS
jgi:hypothetical protein